MLASLSSMIKETSNALSPSNFTQRIIGQQQQQSQQSNIQETDIASTTSVNTTTDDHEHSEVALETPGIVGDFAEEKKKEKKLMCETFVLVRPPPSMSNHPLNLQLQLVPPNSRSSVATSQTPSTRSNRSNTSLYSTPSFSATSIASASTASGASTNSTTRRIIPLYNLSAHNVLTNTVNDAGTDAKVAKFSKRGIEVIGLGILECHEIIGVSLDQEALDALKLSSSSSANLNSKERLSTSNSNFHSREQLPSTSNSNHHQKASSSLIQHEVTPASSVSQLSDSGTGSAVGHGTNTETTPQPQQSLLNPPSTPNANGAKKIFGKMFKRGGKDSPTPSTPSTPTQLPIPTPNPSPLFSRSNKRSSVLSPSSANNNVSSTMIPPNPTPQAATPPSTAEIPTLGVYSSVLYRTKSRNNIVSPNLIASLLATPSGAPLQKSRSKSSFQAVEEIRSREPSHVLVNITEDPPSTKPSDLLPLPPPSIITPSLPAIKRTSHSYEWVMKKWIKGSDAGFLGIKDSLMSAKSAFAFVDHQQQSSQSQNDDSEVIEVRFEWTRGRSSKERARARRAKVSSTGGGERPSSINGSITTTTTPDKRRKSIDMASRSHSPSERPSIDDSGTSDNEQHQKGSVYKGPAAKRSRRLSVSFGGDGIGGGFGEDDDSDPEESETPWTCTLYVGQPSVRYEKSSSQIKTNDNGLKLKLGTLTPAPYHPKVVAQLKMLFPLPDVNVDKQVLIIDRGSVSSPGPKDLILRMEEIKDVVCVTGLWLTVREGFGGLERRRKGDGWKIRG